MRCIAVEEFDPLQRDAQLSLLDHEPVRHEGLETGYTFALIFRGRSLRVSHWHIEGSEDRTECCRSIAC